MKLLVNIRPVIIIGLHHTSKISIFHFQQHQRTFTSRLFGVLKEPLMNLGVIIVSNSLFRVLSELSHNLHLDLRLRL